MKKKYIYNFLVFLLFVFANTNIYSQSLDCYQFNLERHTKIRGNKIYFKHLINKGDESQIDVNKIFEKNLDHIFATYPGNQKKKIQNHISWTTHPMFEKAANEAEADVVIGGTYSIQTGSRTEEKELYENSRYIGGAIPYFELRQINTAKVEVRVSYAYKDKTVNMDTIISFFEYEHKPKTKNYSVDDLLGKCERELNRQMYILFKFYEHEHVWYKFKPVKAKDKAIKQELKLVKDLLKNGEIKKAGSIFLKAYEQDHDNMNAAFNTGLCYELIGNFPKAQEYYAISIDFFTKVRMKSNMELFNYLKEINAILLMEDF